MVEELIVEDGVCKGVITHTGAIFRGKTIVITTGTFYVVKLLLVK